MENIKDLLVTFNQFHIFKLPTFNTQNEMAKVTRQDHMIFFRNRPVTTAKRFWQHGAKNIGVLHASICNNSVVFVPPVTRTIVKNEYVKNKTWRNRWVSRRRRRRRGGVRPEGNMSFNDDLPALHNTSKNQIAFSALKLRPPLMDT